MRDGSLVVFGDEAWDTENQRDQSVKTVNQSQSLNTMHRHSGRITPRRLATGKSVQRAAVIKQRYNRANIGTRQTDTVSKTISTECQTTKISRANEAAQNCKAGRTSGADSVMC